MIDLIATLTTIVMALVAFCAYLAKRHINPFTIGDVVYLIFKGHFSSKARGRISKEFAHSSRARFVFNHVAERGAFGHEIEVRRLTNKQYPWFYSRYLNCVARWHFYSEVTDNLAIPYDSSYDSDDAQTIFLLSYGHRKAPKDRKWTLGWLLFSLANLEPDGWKETRWNKVKVRLNAALAESDRKRK